jgi:hypothetical protein
VGAGLEQSCEGESCEGESCEESAAVEEEGWAILLGLHLSAERTARCTFALELGIGSDPAWKARR